MTLDDIDLVEINEAFASVVLAWHDRDRRRPAREGQRQRRRHRPRPSARRHRRPPDDHPAPRTRAHRRPLRPPDHVRGRRPGQRHHHRTAVVPLGPDQFAVGRRPVLASRSSDPGVARHLFDGLDGPVLPHQYLLDGFPAACADDVDAVVAHLGPRRHEGRNGDLLRVPGRTDSDPDSRRLRRAGVRTARGRLEGIRGRIGRCLLSWHVDGYLRGTSHTGASPGGVVLGALLTRSPWSWRAGHRDPRSRPR